MPLPPNDRSRPAGNGTASKLSNDDTHSLLPNRPRCRHCGHAVWAEESIATGIGRDCRRLLKRGGLEAVA